MLDPRLLRTDPGYLVQALARRGYTLDMDAIHRMDTERRRLQQETEQLQNERKQRSRAIGQAKAAGEDIEPLLAEVGSLGDRLDEKKQAMNEARAAFDDFWLGVPNLP